MPCLGLPAFPCRKTPQPPREDAPVERRRHWPEPQRLGTEPDGGLLGRLPGTSRVADSPLLPQKKKTGTALDEPSPLPSVQPARGIPGITAPPAQPRIPSRRRSCRQERMPCLRLPAFPCRKTLLPPRGDAPVERRRHWPEPRLGTEPDGGLLGRLPGMP